jgi:enterochelin esterase-like enzyme
VLAAGLAPLVLSAVGLGAQIASGLASLSFDEERVFLLGQLLLVLLGAALAGLLFRRRSAAWLGATLYFACAYLPPFLRNALNPPRDIAGEPQAAIHGALAIATLTLLSLGILSAGAGAAIGEASGQLLVTPTLTLVRRLHLRMLAPTAPRLLQPIAVSCVMLAGGTILVAALALASTGVGDILNYGPTGNIYQPALSLPASAKGTLLQGTYLSPALGGASRTFYIYLPPSYDASPTRRYPTLYLLHGSPGGPHNWFGGAHADTVTDSLSASGRIAETIIVGVDGNGPLYRVSQWVNSFNGRQRMEDSIVSDLVPYIDGHYRTQPTAAARIIGGNSEGGFGAINLALHHPAVFGKVICVGGYFLADNSPVFGYGPAAAPYRLLNSPALYVETPQGRQAAHTLRVVIGVGTADRHYYSIGLAFYQKLLAQGIDAHLLTTGGGHSWSVWGAQLADALPLVAPPSSPSNIPAQHVGTQRPCLGSLPFYMTIAPSIAPSALPAANVSPAGQTILDSQFRHDAPPQYPCLALYSPAQIRNATSLPHR